MDENSYKTTYANSSSINKKWLLLDAKDQVLGRLASEVAKIVRGKHKPSFTPHVNCGDHVIVINAQDVIMTGKKWTNRKIFSHSGYTGSQSEHTPASIHARFPERLLEHAVRGMLPKNRLGRQLFKNLHVYSGDNHGHEAQKPEKIKLI